MPAFPTSRVVSMVAGASLALLVPLSASAEQLVLFDITYTHTGANDAHYGISGAGLNQPNNWTSPIDYAQGTIHFYQEVMTKPSNKETIIDFCLISQRDYGCIETFIYTTTGLHETVRSMAGKDVDKRNVIDFTRPMRSIQMVLKTPAPTYINGGRPQSDFLPSKMRFVATLVSPGGTYIRPTPTPGFDPGDGGVPPVVADAGAPVTPDAAAPVVVDAAAPVEVDAAVVAPPAKVDAAAPTPKPPAKDAGASKPPTTKPEDPDEAEEVAPAAASGCSVAGARVGGGLVFAAAFACAALVALRARRRRP
jgi:hypothetical protein